MSSVYSMTTFKDYFDIGDVSGVDIIFVSTAG